MTDLFYDRITFYMKLQTSQRILTPRDCAIDAEF